MEIQPRAFADRSPYLLRMGNPTEWTGDWRRQGRYLRGNQQQQVQERLANNHTMIIGMAVRQVPGGSQTIAAVLGVSREAVDRRLRPLGLKNPTGQVGRPPRRLVA